MKTAAYILIALIIVMLGYFAFAGSTKAPAPTEKENVGVTPATGVGATVTASTTTTVTTTTIPEVTKKTLTVTFDGSSFSPSNISLKVGDTVTFVNTSNTQMWVSSNPHPTHQVYSGTTLSQHCPDTAGTAFDQCTSSASYTFTFLKAGSWGYHNHTNSGVRGTVVVAK